MLRIADLKIWVRLTGAICLVLAVIGVGAILWTTQVNRDTAIRQAKDFSQSIHEMTMAGLTGMMITGTVGQREVFLDQIKQLSVIKDLHVARSEAVSKLYGPDTKSNRSLDPLEQKVMQTGEPYMAVESDGKSSFLHVINPTKAAKNYLGKDCIMCHQVPEGSVLGVVSMKVSLDSVEAEVASLARGRLGAALGALGRARRPAATMLLYVVLGRWLAGSGVAAALAAALVAGKGMAAPFAVVPMGFLAGFVTGSNVGANASLMPVQAALGQALGWGPLVAPALHNFAGAAGAGMAIAGTSMLCALDGGARPGQVWARACPAMALALLWGTTFMLAWR